MAEPWVLAIDFGTSYTVAAVRVGTRTPEVIDIGGSIRVPSVILAENSPVEALAIWRTSSIGAIVPPPVTTTFMNLVSPGGLAGAAGPLPALAGRPRPV